jgi:branched-chain amino acid transport system substrate-binding protein
MDEEVDRAIVAYSQKIYKAKKPGMILVNNPWGESNEVGLKAALKTAGIEPAGIEKFEGNDVDVVSQLSRLKQAGTDTLYLVGNVGPSSQVVKSLDRMSWSPPIVSHWGPAGGRFTELAGPSAKNVIFVQTYSFFGKQSAVGERVIKAMAAKYPNVKGPGDITPAVGVANAYDAMMLTALAIKAAGSTDGDAIRQAFYIASSGRPAPPASPAGAAGPGARRAASRCPRRWRRSRLYCALSKSESSSLDTAAP